MNDDTGELISLEERGWEALSTPGAGPEFYGEVLDAEVVMLLPGGILLDNLPWQARQAAMVGRCAELVEFTHEWEPSGSGEALWRERLALTAASGHVVESPAVAAGGRRRLIE